MSFPPRGRPLAPAALALARLVAVLLLVVCMVLARIPLVAAQTAVTYLPPVDGPVVDGFRPPSSPYGPGNRGLEYATTPGQEVRAAADGEVTFAGRIGASAHVVVVHPDGLRTSYSFLTATSVQRGDQVVQGQVVGIAGPVVHFGARAGERYIDPNLLLGGGPVEVHLVPVELRRAQPEAQERQWLRDLVDQVVSDAWRGLQAGTGAAGDAIGWARDAAVVTAAGTVSLAELAAATGWDLLRPELMRRWTQLVVLASYAGQLPISPLFLLHAVELWERAERFREDQEGCTPPDQPPPPPPPGRRIVVLVAGFGSSSAAADVLDVGTDALGYAGTDVVQFSYAGGRTPGVGSLSGLEESEYGPEDSTGDLRASGRRLRELLEAIRAEHPGVPVDVIAHSQGGVVARLAMGAGGAAPDSRLPPVANLVTMGTPHHGDDAATANGLLGTTGAGQLTQAVAKDLSAGSLDGTSPAAADLAETSSFTRELEEMALPAGTRVTSIAAQGDPTVGALNSPLQGATNVLVPIEGPSAHSQLPGSALTQRELALALSGSGPTCRDLGEGLALSAGISMAEDGLGLAVGGASMWLDHLVPGASLLVPAPGPAAPAVPPPGPTGVGGR
ncbi:MAG: peptidoglycan DD-metalloendopeptidase family protein [Acidimicrobiales bacterium]